MPLLGIGVFQSAGGISVHSLLTIPAAKGLFQKAISESGGPPPYSGPILDGKLVVETAESAYKAGTQEMINLS